MHFRGNQPGPWENITEYSQYLLPLIKQDNRLWFVTLRAVSVALYISSAIRDFSSAIPAIELAQRMLSTPDLDQSPTKMIESTPQVEVSWASSSSLISAAEQAAAEKAARKAARKVARKVSVRVCLCVGVRVCLCMFTCFVVFVFDLFCFLFSYVTILFALIQDAADAEEDRRKKFEAEQVAQKVAL